MAQNLKWYYQFYDLENHLHRIEIRQEGYQGQVYPIEKAATDPIQISHRGKEDSFDFNVIQSKELLFNFYLPRSQESLLDSLLVASYKDYQVIYYIDSEIEFIGYAKTENLTKDFLQNLPYIYISLPVTDGLSELKDIPFKIYGEDGEDTLISGIKNVLEVVRYALLPTNLYLDIKVRMRLIETGAVTSSTQSLLLRLFVRCRRFVDKIEGEYQTTGGGVSTLIKNVFGPFIRLHQQGTKRLIYTEIETTSCYNVIEEILKPLGLRFFQYKGQWWISSPFDTQCSTFTFDFFSFTHYGLQYVYDDRIIIADSMLQLLQKSVIEKKVPPLKELQVIHRTLDLGGEIQIDFTNWALWNIQSPSYTITEDNTLEFYEASSNPLTDDYSAEKSITLATPLNIAEVQQNEYLKIEMIIKHTQRPEWRCNFIHSIDITHPNGETISVFFGGGSAMGMGFDGKSTQGEHLYSTLFSPGLLLAEPGNYGIKISFAGGWTNIGGGGGWGFDPGTFVVGPLNYLEIKEIKFYRILGIHEDSPIAQMASIFDRNYVRQSANKKALNSAQIVYHFLDPLSIWEAGGYFYYNGTTLTQTKNWRKIHTDTPKLLVNFMVDSILDNRVTYKNKLIGVSLVDRENTIDLINFIQIRGKLYHILNYNRNAVLGTINLDLIEFTNIPHTHGPAILGLAPTNDGSGGDRKRSIDLAITDPGDTSAVVRRTDNGVSIAGVLSIDSNRRVVVGSPISPEESSNGATVIVNRKSASGIIQNNVVLNLQHEETEFTNSYTLIGFGRRAANASAYIGYVEKVIDGNIPYGDLIFGTKSTTSNTFPAERMRITRSGNVGIGVEIPEDITNKFQVDGNILVGSSGTFGTGVTGIGINAGVYSKLFSTGTTGQVILGYNRYGAGFGLYALDGFSDVGTSQRMTFRVLNSGNIAIGDSAYNTADNNYRLSVTRSGSSGTLLAYDTTATTGVTRVQLRSGAGQGTTDLLSLYADDGTTDYLLVNSFRIKLNRNTLLAASYLNFGTIVGSTGYGLRVDSGNIQYKHNGGSWANIGTQEAPTGISWNYSNTRIYITPDHSISGFNHGVRVVSTVVTNDSPGVATLIEGRYNNNITSGNPTIAVQGYNYTFTGVSGSSVLQYGVYGGSGNSVGVVGNGATYDFYASGAGTNYGPFTGGHDVELQEDSYLQGMIVVCTGDVTIRKKSITSTLPKVALSHRKNDKNVFGVFERIMELPKDHWNYKQKGNKKFGIVNALGEGMVLVTNINGNIQCGDYITTSEIAGYGMKQNDDILHNYTLGKCTQNINWENIKKTIIFGNKKYKVCLISCVYFSA